MAVKVQYEKINDATAAFDKVKTNITPETIAKYNVKADLQYLADEKRILAKGSGFQMKMDFMADHVLIDLDLSLFLKPFKTKILESLEKQIRRLV